MDQLDWGDCVVQKLGLSSKLNQIGCVFVVFLNLIPDPSLMKPQEAFMKLPLSIPFFLETFMEVFPESECAVRVRRD